MKSRTYYAKSVSSRPWRFIIKGTIYIGTSGWHYKHWKGTFYPKNLKSGDFLQYYSKKFDTVEINNSFYRLPDKKRLLQWKGTVPKSFSFSIKASRYITHVKKLKDHTAPLGKFLKRAYVLEDRLGPLLFQLPPRFRFNEERFRGFSEDLPNKLRSAFEFRDHSWINKAVFDILKDRGCAFCIYHLAGFLSPRVVTTDFIYIRLHGPGKKYQGSYDGRTLRGWARKLGKWSRSGRDVYLYFDNDDNGYAPKNALRLKEMLEDEGG